MSALVQGVARSSLQVVKSPLVVSKANLVTLGSGPPRVRISFAEKVVCGVVLSAGISAPSMYLLTRVKHYRNRPAAE